MSLTAKQEEQLHSAILDYLETRGLAESAAALARETGATVDPKRSGLLAKKWTSVVRLQKKVLELEQRIAEGGGGGGGGGGRRAGGAGGAGGGDALPRTPERHVLRGFRSGVTRVRFHPVYTLLAAAGEDASVRVWDYESGAFERTLKGHTAAVHDVAFGGASGAVMASCSADLTVKLWDFGGTYACTKTLYGHDHSVSALCFTPSGDHLLSASRDQTIKIWEVKTGFCVQSLHGHDSWVRCITVAPDGRSAFSGSSDHSVRAWKLDTAGARSAEDGDWRGHDHVVECVAVNAVEVPKVLCDNATRVWAKVAPGKLVASGSRDNVIRLWNAENGDCVAMLEGHENWVRAVFFHPNGRYLLSAADDKSIRVWDLTQARCIKVMSSAHEHFVATLDYSDANGACLATGSVDSTVKVWDCR